MTAEIQGSSLSSVLYQNSSAHLKCRVEGRFRHTVNKWTDVPKGEMALCWRHKSTSI